MHTGESRNAENLRTALGPVLDHNSGRWLRFIAGILGNETDAEDVIQEAVRRVLARGLPLHSQEHVRMYLGRAIGNAALEFYNNRKRERMRLVPIQENTLVPDITSDPQACMEEKEESDERERLLRLLEKGMAYLPRKQYEALRLTILEARGVSIRDIGITNGIPYSTLRHRSKQGLRQLRRYLRRSLAKNDENQLSENIATHDLA